VNTIDNTQSHQIKELFATDLLAASRQIETEKFI